MKSTFQPNKLTFEQGLQRVRVALAEVAEFQSRGIVTSRDAGAERIEEALRVHNVPEGFTKYQLPVFMEGGPGAQFFVSIGNPGTTVARHSHDEGDGLRVVLSGSIRYDGKELSQGDWMYVPKGAQYEFVVGSKGATMFYCYQCCCA